MAMLGLANVIVALIEVAFGLLERISFAKFRVLFDVVGLHFVELLDSPLDVYMILTKAFG